MKEHKARTGSVCGDPARVPAMEPYRPATSTIIRGGVCPIPAELQGLVERELEPGEQLIWVGRANPGRSGLWAVSVALLVLLVVIVTAVLTIGGVSLLPVLLGFLPVPLAVPFLAAAALRLDRRARKTAYAITTRRALILTAGPTLAITSYHGHDLGAIHRAERRDGTGDLVFGRTVSARHPSTNLAETAFVGIPDVRTVAKLLENLANSGKDGETST